MRKAYLSGAVIMLLAGCSEAPALDAAAAEKPSGMAHAVSSVEVETIKAQRSAEAEDRFLECAETKPNGITTRQFFLIKDGAVKSYSQMQNRARNMCDAGQPGCALGWQGEKVALFFKTNSGAVNRMLLDLETLTLEKQLTTASKGDEFSSMSCTSGPFPDGVVIE